MGIGKTDESMAVFVPNTAVGDTVKVIIVKVLKNYCFGKAVEFIELSSDRTEPNCEVFSRCGGCCYRHITYDAELKIKQQRVADAIQRIGKIDVPVLDIIGSEKRDHYRNKAQFPIGKDKDGKAICGFYALHSHRIIEQTDCGLQPAEFKQILDVTLKFINDFRIPVYDEQKHSGVVRHVYLRSSAAGEIMLCLVINADRLPKEMERELVSRITLQCKNVSTVILNINKKQTGVILGGKNRVLFGNGFITDTLCGVRVKISPLSFYQVNRDTAEKLYEIAADYAQPDDKTVLDLYCGAGTIGLSIAKRAKQIIGVEIVESAVKDAVYNAEQNSIDNARFICANATDAAAQLNSEGIRPDVVILDPPRKGAERQLIETIANGFAPNRVVYVSCDPATLARDLAVFAQLGYETQKIQPVDMFPTTSHVETVCLMSRKDK